MGIDWICTARPREGHEAEYARLRAVALAELDLLEGFDSTNWYSERHQVDGEELAAVLRLHEISVYPGETWKAFLGELWDEARETVRQGDEIPLPEEARWWCSRACRGRSSRRPNTPGGYWSGVLLTVSSRVA